MQHLQSLENTALDGVYAAIGTFDGVHRGHQTVLRSLVEDAHTAGSPAVVVTFYPHPMVVLRGIQNPYYLTGPDERAALIGQTGVDAVITLPFDRALAALSARDFMQLLSHHLGLRSLWVGFNFALGHNREGGLPALEQIGRDLGYSLHITQPVEMNGGPVSSSQVRASLTEGNVRQAAELLNRRYSVSGPITHGDGRGSTIGFPTANLNVWPMQLLPTNGVYATWIVLDGQRIPSVTNVGLRPTFESTAMLPRVEAHLIDFKQDLYGKNLTLEFVEFLRPEQRFASVQGLIDQIHLDRDHAKEVLKHDA